MYKVISNPTKPLQFLSFNRTTQRARNAILLTYAVHPSKVQHHLLYSEPVQYYPYNHVAPENATGWDPTTSLKHPHIKHNLTYVILLLLKFSAVSIGPLDPN